ncbi:MAG: hypothetical protein PHP63_06580 [Candidatus Marinimicrobia bacterium]|nr:hypothetical protein [Candidatus Neomarinimicrobiota bacterium]
MQVFHQRTNKRILLMLCLVFFLFPLTAQIPLEDKIAQMIMVGFTPNTDFEDTLYYDIAYRNLGGVILMGNNIQSPVRLRFSTLICRIMRPHRC